MSHASWRPARESLAPAAPITAEERAVRAARAFDFVPGGVDALVLFDEQYVQYYTGFVYSSTERPIGLVILRGGERTLFVPRLELEHAEQASVADAVLSYPEYPGERHPMLLLADHLRALGVKRVGVDHDGYPVVAGYQPFPLSRELPVELVSPQIDLQLALKSEHELALIRESIYWGDVAHELLQRYTRPGLSESEVVGRACREATELMRAARGGQYRQVNRWISGALAIYRGQIGPHSALPHALTNDAVFEVGHTLVTGAGADVFGYLSELERTMFIGEPSPEQRRYFDHMLNLQEIAFEAMAPGVPCAEVDRAVRAYYEREGLWDGWRHHVGHSLGQRIHESPFLDIGDETLLQPGMVFSIEPGIYVPGLGGFRHSDTVMVTDSGIELMTYYPRGLEALIIPVD
ncbi:MAG: aminopeptidase P family protein [Deinococcales bacterium]|nr:aminopeptidase P family protein [Deinococcales bacterium]